MTFPSLPPSGFQIISATLLLSLLTGVRSQAPGFDRLNVDTPNPVGECGTTKFQWQGGQPPFTLHITFQKNNSVFYEFANLTGTAQTWQAAIPAGNVLYLELFDSSDNGSSAFSHSFTIQPGNDACLPSATATSSNTSTVATNSDYPSTGGFTPTSSPVTLPSNPAVADPSGKVSTRALSTGAIAGIAVASLVAGLLIALGVWLIRKRKKPSSSPRIPTQRQLDTYHYPQPSRSDDGWSVTTPRDPEDELRSQPDEDKTGPSWDPSLFVREKTPSPSPPMDHPVVTRQGLYILEYILDSPSSHRLQ
ncbi:hypothetical protein LXA43DRAFT_1102670 [Ganoderma leucocontextum]|nr:hypothetical protein LXA43DRAFT_1102670 [Ganoderma leucocontextum]